MILLIVTLTWVKRRDIYTFGGSSFKDDLFLKEIRYLVMPFCNNTGAVADLIKTIHCNP